MKRLLSLLAIFACTPASAQNTSDLQNDAMKQLPTVAPGTQMPGYPGAPAPPPPVAPSTPGKLSKSGDAADDKPTGRIIYDTNPFENDNSEVTVDERPPETHVVVKGDTLWGLSQTYFHNAWYWPKLWAFNPSITNPHWIYPGDVIRLAAGTGGEPTPIASTPTPEVKRPPMRSESSNGYFLRQMGFVEPGELKSAAVIVGSKEEKLMLATLDEAYVEFTKEKPMLIGERYTVFRSVQPVKHPVTGKYVGDLVQIYGDVEVKSVTDSHIARVVIVDSTDPMERGFKVGPLKRQFRSVDPKASRQDLIGVILTTLDPRQLVGTELMVFVDKGKKDGVEVGNRFLVVRRGDGYGYKNVLDTMPHDDHRFPRETLAELLVIEVKDSVATCVCTRQVKEVKIGDRVEAHRNF